MSDVILCNLSDANETIKEAKTNWLNDVLLYLGISEEILYSNSIELQRHEISNNYGIEIDSLASGNINVYKKQWNKSNIEELEGWLPVKQENLVAQWKEPTRIRKVEGQEIYYELHLNEWSIANTRK